jgi:hypothetical protein
LVQQFFYFLADMRRVIEIDRAAPAAQTSAIFLADRCVCFLPAAIGQGSAPPVPWALSRQRGNALLNQEACRYPQFYNL